MNPPIQTYEALMFFNSKPHKIPNETVNDLSYVIKNTVPAEKAKLPSVKPRRFTLEHALSRMNLNTLDLNSRFQKTNSIPKKRKIKKKKNFVVINHSKEKYLTSSFYTTVVKKGYFKSFLVDTFWMIYSHFYLLKELETLSFSVPSIEEFEKDKMNENAKNNRSKKNVGMSPLRLRKKRMKRHLLKKRKLLRKIFLRNYSALIKRMGAHFIKIKYLLKMEVLDSHKTLSDVINDHSSTQLTMFLTQVTYRIFRMAFPYFFFSFYWRKLCYLYIRRWCIGGINHVNSIFPAEKKFLLDYSNWRINTTSKHVKPEVKKRTIRKIIKATVWAKEFVKRGKEKVIRRRVEKQWKTFLKDTKDDNVKKLKNELELIDKRAFKSVKNEIVSNRKASRGARFSNLPRFRRATVSGRGKEEGSRRAKKEINTLPKKRYSVGSGRPGLFIIKSHKITSPLIDSYFNPRRFFSGNFHNKLEVL